MSNTECRQAAIVDLLDTIKQSESLFPGILEEVRTMLHQSNSVPASINVLKRSAKQIAESVQSGTQSLVEHLRPSRGGEIANKKITIAISSPEIVTMLAAHAMHADYRLPIKVLDKQYGEIVFYKDDHSATHYIARPLMYIDFSFGNHNDIFMDHVKIAISAILANAYVENTLSRAFGLRTVIVTPEMAKRIHAIYNPCNTIFDTTPIGLCVSDGTMQLKALDIGTWIVVNDNSTQYNLETGLTPKTLAFFAEPLDHTPLSDKTLMEYSVKLYQALLDGIGVSETDRLFHEFSMLHQNFLRTPNPAIPSQNNVN